MGLNGALKSIMTPSVGIH